MSLELQVQTSPVPSNFCFEGFNSPSWLDLVALMYVTFPSDLSLFNFGNTVPSPDKRDRPWIRTNADGTSDGIWVYAMGSWLQKHEVAAGTVVMYEGTELSIPTFDGGEAGAVTTISGPFWEKVSQIDGRFPLGPGTLQPSTTVVAIGDTGGVDEHTLTKPEMPTHDHGIPDGHHLVDDTAAVQNADLTAGSSVGETEFSEEGGDQPHTNMPPYYAMWFIRRTARLYRRI